MTLSPSSRRPAPAHDPSPDRIVREAAARICASLDLDETLEAIAWSAKRALRADRATCYVHELESTRIASVHTTEEDPRRRAFLERSVGSPIGDLPVCRAQLELPDPVLAVEDVSAWEQINPLLRARLGSGALIGVRLEHGLVRGAHGQRLLGTLYCSYRQSHTFTDDERSVAGGLANLASLAIANARLHAQTLRSLAQAEHRADTDELTGLANRRAVERRLESEVAAATRSGEAVSVLVVDLDDFKAVNDRHGHPVGDRCLRAVGAAIEAALRPGDIVGRLGGEEFLVVLCQTGPESAWLVAERLRARVRETTGPWGRVSASLGVAGVPEHGHTAAEVVRAADAAMYEAKALGRDRSVVHSRRRARARTARARHDQAGREAYLGSVLALAAAVDARDASTHAHSARVAAYASAVGAQIGLDGDRLEQLRIAGLLHDVGKVGVPDAVLLKPGPLDDDEFAQMRRHPEIGADLLVHPDLAEIREWVLCHHERPDGRGYPAGLSGADIPREALVLGVADAYEAMTADRPYRRALPPEEARAELVRGRGAQFDSGIVDAFLGCIDTGLAVAPAPVAPLVAPALGA
jgi:diguanylate cyclase (GGDEF)-like protein